MIQLLIAAVTLISFSLPLHAAESWEGKKCQIWRDDQSIAHVKAQGDLHGYACLGYLHGRDRGWQVDFFKRTVEGTKAEVFGKDSIRSDFMMRLLGLKERAVGIYSQMSASQQAIFKAYAAGMNKGLSQAIEETEGGRGYEFKKYGYLPGHSEPEDALAMLLLQSFDQTRKSFENQISEDTWIGKHPKESTELFSTVSLPWDISILKSGEYPAASTAQASIRSPGSLPEVDTSSLLPGIWNGPGVGSNNWVISSAKSKSGHALLANDPHVSLTHPPFWYWVHLNTGDNSGGSDVIGASFPGIPVITMGANRTVSWGVTNANLPVSRVSRVSEEELNRAKDTTTVRPVIWFKWWKFKIPFVFKTFKRTPTGLPVLPLPSPDGQAMVLRTTAYDLKPGDFLGLLELSKVKTVADADRVLGTVGLPAWNLVFADTQGGIGYRAIGRCPRFPRTNGGVGGIPFGIPFESLEKVENAEAFRNPLTADEMPHVLNPKRGWISTANNQQWPADSKWSLGTAQVVGCRAMRIEELLAQTPMHDLQSMQKIQCDLQAIDAKYLLPELLKSVVGMEGESTDLSAAIAALKAWSGQNYETTLDCRACGVYRRWVGRIYESQGLNFTALYRANKDPGFSLRTGLQGTIRTELKSAVAELKAATGTATPAWGQVHLNTFTHFLGKTEFVAKPIGTPGDDLSVNPGTSDWDASEGILRQRAGASQRILVEMSQPVQVYSVVPGPQLDLDHRDLAEPKSEWQKWLKCEQNKRIFPLDWSTVAGKGNVEEVEL